MTAATLDALDYVPRSVLDHVAHQLSLPAPELATVCALYRSERTRFADQAWAWRHSGFHWPTPGDVAAVGEVLLAGTSATVDRHRFARRTREAPYARGCLIPRERDIEDWVRRAFSMSSSRTDGGSTRSCPRTFASESACGLTPGGCDAAGR
jgi:hypothetical protein